MTEKIWEQGTNLLIQLVHYYLLGAKGYVLNSFMIFFTLINEHEMSAK